jgi:lipid II:glycine glycyltransferase (peptidoglycan interpeptide bridge formation enzyme)
VNQLTIKDPSRWNQIVTSIPGGHLLQSWEWGELKEKYGWRVIRLSWQDENSTPLAAAQVLQRGLPVPATRDRITMLYCPRGPALDWSNAKLRRWVLGDLVSLARSKRSIFLRIDPAVPMGYGFPEDEDAKENPVGDEVRTEIQDNGWRSASEQVQFAKMCVWRLVAVWSFNPQI